MDDKSSSTQQHQSVDIVARLVQKSFFTTRKQDGRTLNKCGLIFLDLSGRTLDIDIWSVDEWMKAQHLYRKLKPNQVYTVSNCSRFIPTDKKWSNSQLKVASPRGLWIEPHADDTFNSRSYVPCTTSVTEGCKIIQDRGTANLMATFLARHRGPRKYFDGTRDLIALGHLVEFEDKNGIKFFVLLWQPKNVKASYPLFAAEPGEIMLLPNCRPFTRPLETNRYVQDPNAVHLTTLCHAVSNSLAVSPDKFRELRRRVNKRHETNNHGGDAHSSNTSNATNNTKTQSRRSNGRRY